MLRFLAFALLILTPVFGQSIIYQQAFASRDYLKGYYRTSRGVYGSTTGAAWSLGYTSKTLSYSTLGAGYIRCMKSGSGTSTNYFMEAKYTGSAKNWYWLSPTIQQNGRVIQKITMSIGRKGSLESTDGLEVMAFFGTGSVGITLLTAYTSASYCAATTAECWKQVTMTIPPGEQVGQYMRIRVYMRTSFYNEYVRLDNIKVYANAKQSLFTAKGYTMRYVAQNRVCGQGDYGGFTTTVKNAWQCAQQCLSKYPKTRYIEYKTGDCDCDSAAAGKCTIGTLPSTGWTVYSVAPGAPKVTKFYTNAVCSGADATTTKVTADYTSCAIYCQSLLYFAKRAVNFIEWRQSDKTCECDTSLANKCTKVNSTGWSVYKVTPYVTTKAPTPKVTPKPLPAGVLYLEPFPVAGKGKTGAGNGGTNFSGVTWRMRPVSSTLRTSTSWPFVSTSYFKTVTKGGRTYLEARYVRSYVAFETPTIQLKGKKVGEIAFDLYEQYLNGVGDSLAVYGYFGSTVPTLLSSYTSSGVANLCGGSSGCWTTYTYKVPTNKQVSTYFRLLLRVQLSLSNEYLGFDNIKISDTSVVPPKVTVRTVYTNYICSASNKGGTVGRRSATECAEYCALKYKGGKYIEWQRTAPYNCGCDSGTTSCTRRYTSGYTVYSYTTAASPTPSPTRQLPYTQNFSSSSLNGLGVYGSGTSLSSARARLNVKTTGWKFGRTINYSTPWYLYTGDWMKVVSGRMEIKDIRYRTYWETPSFAQTSTSFADKISYQVGAKGYIRSYDYIYVYAVIGTAKVQIGYHTGTTTTTSTSYMCKFSTTAACMSKTKTWTVPNMYAVAGRPIKLRFEAYCYGSSDYMYIDNISITRKTKVVTTKKPVPKVYYTPYTEDFTYTGFGCLGATSAKPTCTWSASGRSVDWRVGQLDSSWYLYAGDYFRTSGGSLIAHDVNEGVWFQTPVINQKTSSPGNQIMMRVGRSGYFYSGQSDYFRIYALYDGSKTKTPLKSFTGLTTGSTAMCSTTSTCWVTLYFAMKTNWKKVQIRVELSNNNSGEYWRLDYIKVQKGAITTTAKPRPNMGPMDIMYNESFRYTYRGARGTSTTTGTYSLTYETWTIKAKDGRWNMRTSQWAQTYSGNSAYGAVMSFYNMGEAAIWESPNVPMYGRMAQVIDLMWGKSATLTSADYIKIYVMYNGSTSATLISTVLGNAQAPACQKYNDKCLHPFHYVIPKNKQTSTSVKIRLEVKVAKGSTTAPKFFLVDNIKISAGAKTTKLPYTEAFSYTAVTGATGGRYTKPTFANMKNVNWWIGQINTQWYLYLNDWMRAGGSKKYLEAYGVNRPTFWESPAITLSKSSQPGKITMLLGRTGYQSSAYYIRVYAVFTDTKNNHTPVKIFHYAGTGGFSMCTPKTSNGSCTLPVSYTVPSLYLGAMMMRIRIEIYNGGSGSFTVDNIKVMQAGNAPSPCTGTSKPAATSCSSGWLQVAGTGTTVWDGVYQQDKTNKMLYKSVDGAKFVRMTGMYTVAHAPAGSAFVMGSPDGKLKWTDGRMAGTTVIISVSCMQGQGTQKPTTGFKVNDRVEVNYLGNGDWYAATIEAESMQPNTKPAKPYSPSRWKVVLDDGREQAFVQEKYLKALSASKRRTQFQSGELVRYTPSGGNASVEAVIRIVQSNGSYTVEGITSGYVETGVTQDRLQPVVLWRANNKVRVLDCFWYPGTVKKALPNGSYLVGLDGTVFQDNFAFDRLKEPTPVIPSGKTCQVSQPGKASRMGFILANRYTVKGQLEYQVGFIDNKSPSTGWYDADMVKAQA